MPLCGIAGNKLLAAKNVLDHTVHSSREDSQNRLWFWGLVFFNPLHTPTRVVCKQVSELDCAGILLSMEGDCPQNPLQAVPTPHFLKKKPCLGVILVPAL